ALRRRPQQQQQRARRARQEKREGGARLFLGGCSLNDTKVKRSLDDHASGPEVFNQLLRLIGGHFDQGDGNASFNRLQTFGVSNGTPFSDFFRAFRVVVSSVTGSEHVLAPSVPTVLELVRRSVMNQYPGLMPTLYPGDWATVPTPFTTIDAMWLAFRTMATNKTPAISGEN
ncbi:unnamed protein product, partial [Laminaria digitata]